MKSLNSAMERKQRTVNCEVSVVILCTVPTCSTFPGKTSNGVKVSMETVFEVGGGQ
jgi:hypothetical protein